MAAVTINERFVKLARVDESMRPAVSGQALDAGRYVTQAADGRYVLGGVEGGAIVCETVLTANAPISPLRKGILDVGNALASRAPGTVIYAHNGGATPGVLDDAATHVEGATTFNHVRVGVVEAGRGDLDGAGAAQRRYLVVDL